MNARQCHFQIRTFEPTFQKHARETLWRVPNPRDHLFVPVQALSNS